MWGRTGWHSLTRGLSQIWLHGQKGKLKNLGLDSYILAICWNLLSKYGNFGIFFFPSWCEDLSPFPRLKKNICIIYTSTSFVATVWKIHPPKKTFVDTHLWPKIPMYLILIIIIWTFKLTFKYFKIFSHKRVVYSKIWNLTMK